MLVSCGAEGSIAVTQRFFCEFRFRFRVSASNSVMPGGSRISLKLLSYPGRTICTCNNHRVPQSPSMQNGLKMGKRSSPFLRFTAKQASPFQCPGDHVDDLQRPYRASCFNGLGTFQSAVRPLPLARGLTS